LSLYRVHFKWKGKDVTLSARSLDLTHPYFVSIKELYFPTEESIIINPAEDDLRRAFSESDHVMIPFQTVALIEELREDEKHKVMPFSIVDSDGSAGEESDQEA
jgi:hypothetical protein